MDKKRTRYSLSRKRKKSNPDEEDTSRDVCVLGESSEKTVPSLDENSVESKENRTQTSFPDVKVELSRQNNIAKKSIATWFKKPCDPKTVSCPMCGKVVILSKINQHLDNNCKSYFGQHNLSSSKAASKANRLPGSNSHRGSVKKGTVSEICEEDCKVDDKRPQSGDEDSIL